MMKTSSLDISLIPYEEFQRIQLSNLKPWDTLRLISSMCRFNTFSAVKLAGSGHLGSSFSALDIFVYLYFYEMNVLKVGHQSPDRDIFFSSKGHDVPSHYSVLAACGILNLDKLKKLRRLDGLDGHPDVGILGIEANSGSLGMGISKAKGMAFAKKLNQHGGRVFVMLGDGELQEGQIWESFQNAHHQKVDNLIVIIDHNKVQTDKLLTQIIDVKNLEEKLSAFGWHVERCDGHSFEDLSHTLHSIKQNKDQPQVIIADTIKGKGISFMEHPQALEEGGGLYRWHSGAPSDDDFERGSAEILHEMGALSSSFQVDPPKIQIVETREKGRMSLKDTVEKVVRAYEESLCEMGRRRKDIIVLDADLSSDCGLRSFEKEFPERFIECGIAEQDMVSTAGGLALQGYLPIVNSFSTFLSARSNEQIYNNATEFTKIIYVCHFAGLIPAGPGKSHQGVRDISLFQALPNMMILEPCNEQETKMVLEYCVEEAKTNCMIRLAISPSPRKIKLPDDYHLTFGKGVVLHEGQDGVMFSYGPVMLNEALCAAEVLKKQGIRLKIINMPWLNRVDIGGLDHILGECPHIFVLENHFIRGGLGDFLTSQLVQNGLMKMRTLSIFGLETFPECGTPQEVLSHHELNGQKLASRIMRKINDENS